jgi:heme exporter protein A
MTPREMLGFWGALRGVRRPASDAAIAAFGLERTADWPCRWLSAGQRKRLALARLIAAPAPVWLLDEPGAALDSDGEARLTSAIAAHRAAGGRIAVATHQPIAVPTATILALDDFTAPPREQPVI